MFERLSNGWEMAQESYRVLKLDKELLLFPLFSGICCTLVMASFLVPAFLNDQFRAIMDNPDAAAENPVVWILTFLFYFLNYFVIVFFNSALVACAIIRFRGGDPTVADGFRAASKRLPVIFGWALVSATVGILLKAIESRNEKVGAILSAILGAGWTIATYFVVPVLVVENVGPVDAVKRSWGVMRKTWGESLGANFGVGFIVFLGTIVCFLPLFGGGYLLAQGSAALGGVLMVVGLIGLMIVSLVSSALNTIILAALYLYAADHEAPQNFDQRLLRNAFATR